MKNIVLTAAALLCTVYFTAGYADPMNVSVNHVHMTRAIINWTHNENAVSNLVTISETTDRDIALSLCDSYDFELCVNNSDNDTQDKSKDVAAKYPEFSGEKIYYPGKSEGVLRISTSTVNGRLTHVGYPCYDGMAIEITAKRYSIDKNCKRIYVYYLDDEQQPREVGSMDIGDEYSTGRISLSRVPAGAELSIGNLDGYKSNRRFLIDRIDFLETPAIAATSGKTISMLVADISSCRVNGLEMNTEYLVTVKSFDGEGNVITASDPTVFTTTGKERGMMCRFR